MNRRSFIHRLGLALLAGLFSFSVQAGDARLAKNLIKFDPVRPTDTPGKIEVVEFFSYGCPHCAEFNPMLEKWVAKQGKDVVFKRVPITFGRAAWANASRLYYALETTGQLAKLDNDVFAAIHQQRINLFDPNVTQDWIGKKGEDQKKFSEAFNSFGIQSKVKRGDQVAMSHNVDGVPALAINGAYLITADEGFDSMLAAADKLIAQMRSASPAKK